VFTKKEVDIFDKEVFEKGKVVVYCYTNKIGTDLFQENATLVGIVTEVTESYIRLLTWNGDKLNIYIHQLLGSPAHDKTAGRHFKIFNVFSPKELKELGKGQ
jgi:hypothetical protein